MMAISATWLLNALTSLASDQSTVPTGGEPPVFSFGKVFTFLFLTLGPLKIIGPFAEMTRGRDVAFATLPTAGAAVAAVDLLVAVTIGTRILDKWGISLGALLLQRALCCSSWRCGRCWSSTWRTTLEQRPLKPPRRRSIRSKTLAITPLAFPTIVTPYGVAVLILLMALGANRVIGILAVAAAVLVVDLLAKLRRRPNSQHAVCPDPAPDHGNGPRHPAGRVRHQTAAAGVRLLGLAGAGAG